ncbi:aldo/keto reductase [Corynebacterium pilosum]|uniref:Predicted oxidoreductase n=1 Tax=Corynebacterium pilosum TaxID=35756 RepID=A0A376CPS4_9CORY|nr:aldo/keto reductase [Corynebacterium pilosum]STC70272.1 predicted oxidoreductase [Corynebacterium pilosum]
MAHITNTDIDIYPLNLGGNPFGWTADKDATFAILDGFTERGGNFVDTADSYSNWAEGNAGGESEELIGQWLASRKPQNFHVATKSGGLDGVNGRSRRATTDAVEGSLRRLGIETIDLFYYHWDDEEVAIDEQVAIANDLIEAGKIRYLGLSNYTPERMRAFFKASEGTSAQPVAMQNQYSLLHRKEFEEGYQPIATEFGASVFPYFALASGMLTGKYRSADDLSGAARAGMAEGYASDEAFALIDTLVARADEAGAEPATVALAWLLAKGVTAPVASVSRVDQLDSLMAAGELTLSEETVEALDAASTPFA